MQPEPIICLGCDLGVHCDGAAWIPTGYQVPSLSGGYRNRSQMVPEVVRCQCECGKADE